MVPMMFFTWYFSYDYVRLSGQREFADIIKIITNQLTLKWRDYHIVKDTYKPGRREVAIKDSSQEDSTDL